MKRWKQVYYHLGGLTLGTYFHLAGIYRAVFTGWSENMKKWVAIIFALLCLIFVVLILSGAPNREVVWFIVPIGGLYRMIAGTYNKVVPRFLLPALVAVAYLLLVGLSWWLLFIYASYLLVQTLPFTLIGNSVHESWINWVWIWILGYLNGIASLSLGIPLGLIWSAVFLAFIPMVVYGIFGTLSNVKSTAKWFPWKMCEFAFGSSALIAPSMLINNF